MGIDRFRVNEAEKQTSSLPGPGTGRKLKAEPRQSLGARRFDQKGKTQGLVDEPLAVMRHARVGRPAIALDNADPAGDVLKELVPGAEQFGRNG